MGNEQNEISSGVIVPHKSTHGFHWLGRDDNPGGGHSYGHGFAIAWQNGALTLGPRNGASVEEVIEAAIGRVMFFQEAAGGKFACDENEAALAGLRAALKAMNDRTAKRVARGVEGTHTPCPPPASPCTTTSR